MGRTIDPRFFKIYYGSKYIGTLEQLQGRAGKKAADPATVGRRRCHQLLGIGRNATVAEIRAAYRRSALKNHPDRGGDQEMMAKINAAYEEALRLATRA